MFSSLSDSTGLPTKGLFIGISEAYLVCEIKDRDLNEALDRNDGDGKGGTDTGLTVRGDKKQF